MLVNVSKKNLQTRVLGSNISIPIGMSPSALQKMAHPDGEIGAVKAAQKAGIVYTLSTISTYR